jgi:arylformamidase
MAVERIVDISLGISEGLLTWPGDPAISVERTSRISAGDPANVSLLQLGTHTGTHVDPPAHFIEGADPIDRVPLDVLVGEALVGDLTAADAIGPAELEALSLPVGIERLLCKTRNSLLWSRDHIPFPEEYVAVTPEGARWIVDRGLRLIGVDFLSVEKDGPPDFPVHHVLLRGGTIIVEGLDLSGVEPGSYRLTCLPLRILGGDGGPARAVLTRS